MHGRSTWSRISKLSKDKCIEQLSVHSILKNVHRTAISSLDRGFVKFVKDNIEIEQSNTGQIYIGTATCKMSQVISVTPDSRPDLFSNGVSCYDNNQNGITANIRKKRKIYIGLHEGEQDILKLPVPDDKDQDDIGENDENYLPDL